MKRLTANSEFKQGQMVSGVYCGMYFEGRINENTRPTPDGKNIIFGVTISPPISVYGQLRSRLEIATNDFNTITTY